MKYRVGRNQGRVILDENSRQVAICEKGQEAVAQRLCDLLNEYGLEKNLNLHSVSGCITIYKSNAYKYNTDNMCNQLHNCKCGNSCLYENDKFCSKCGVKLRFI